MEIINWKNIRLQNDENIKNGDKGSKCNKTLHNPKLMKVMLKMYSYVR